MSSIYSHITAKFGRIIAAALLSALIFFSTDIDCRADTKVTVSFAAGGAVCGIYFFFYFTASHLLDSPAAVPDHTALINGSPDGWKLGVPRLEMLGDEQSPRLPCLQIIRVQF